MKKRYLPRIAFLVTWLVGALIFYVSGAPFERGETLALAIATTLACSLLAHLYTLMVTS